MPKLYSNGFGATFASFYFRKKHSVQKLWREKQAGEQANMQISTGLPGRDVLDLRALEAQDVTTKGVYRLPHAIYYCSYPVSDSPY